MEEQKKESLVRKIVIIVSLVVVVTFVTLIWFSVSQARNIVVKNNIEDINLIADSYATNLSNWIITGVEALDMYTKSDLVYNNESPEEIGKWLTTTTSRRFRDFNYVLFIDAKGNSFYDSGKTGNHSDRAYYKRISSGEVKYCIENPTIAKATGKVSVMVVKGAYAKNGALVGMFVGVHALDYLQQTIGSFKLGKDGFAFLLDGNGVVVSHKISEYCLSTNFLTDEGISEDLRMVAKDMVSGNESYGYIQKGRSDESFVSYAPVKETPWSVAICVPKDQINHSANYLRAILIIGDLVIAIVLLVVIFILVGTSLAPLGSVVKTIDGIASGNADLSQRIPQTNNTEIGQVVLGFNKFISKIHSIIIKVKRAKDSLVDVNGQFGASIGNTESAISQIIANIEDVKTHINENNNSIQGTVSAVTQITSNIQSLEQMIENQASGVTEASAAIEEMIANIGSVNVSVEKMTESFDELQKKAIRGAQKQQTVNERIEQIESQSAMLEEANAAIAAIAGQTNLLAMNAAIEAAHAGEAGKGFSVVADEIRKLSETSSTQSRTIGEQLNKIKQSIVEVVSSSSESSQAFTDVSNNIELTDQIVRQISASMQEQQEGSKQILEALQMMSNTTQEVRSSSIEMTNGSRAILDDVKLLQQYTEEMKSSVGEMDIGVQKIDQTGKSLHEIASTMQGSIDLICEEIDQFKV